MMECVCYFVTVIDNCASDPCVNGRCANAVGSYKCHCFPGYTGSNCEESEYTINYHCYHDTC